MFRLRATFKIRLPQPLLIHARQLDERDNRALELVPDPETTRLSFAVGEFFRVRARFIPRATEGSLEKGERAYRIHVAAVALSVQRLELEAPIEASAPETSVMLQEYLWARREQYQEAAQVALDRIFQYFRYVKGHPFLRNAKDVDLKYFANPLWSDGKGRIIWDRKSVFVVKGSAAIPAPARLERTRL